MSKYESIVRYGITFIDIKAAEALRKELNEAMDRVECGVSLHKRDVARIAELEEQLSVWRSVFPALAPRLFPESGDE